MKKDKIVLKPTFEESFDLINREIQKRKNKWNLTSLNWVDYDDVSQIIRLHIYEKWHLYDNEKPLTPWLNRIISNQIKNLIRNYYGNFSRPCLKCEASEEETSCKIYTSQCSDCPVYAKWEKSKKSARDIKIPLALNDHLHEVNAVNFNSSSSVEDDIKKMHVKMKEILKPNEWIVYESLYMENLEENEVAKRLGFISNEKNRNPGYKQIKNLKKIIIKKAKDCLSKDGIEML